MSDFSTQYLGLKLANPLIASSSSLSANIDGIKRLASAGIGAIVLKSLFEEQVESDTHDISDDYSHSEAYEYLQQSGMSIGAGEYLKLIQEAKDAVSVPIIASMNCISDRWWKEYAIALRDSGADALEINLSSMPQRFNQSSTELEDELVSTFEKIRKLVDLPVAVKLGPYFSSLPALSLRLRSAGADALVLFNRFYQYDFDLLSGQAKGRISLTSDRDYSLALRWVSILFERSGMQLSASTGIHNGETALKMIAAGADTVQLCSVFYRSNTEAVSTILSQMKGLVEQLHLTSLDELRGRNSQKDSPNPEVLERLQYVKALTGIG